jgi:hypothetical protein
MDCNGEQNGSDSRIEQKSRKESIVLQRILGGNEAAVDEFFAAVWQRACATFRYRPSAATNSKADISSSSSSPVWSVERVKANPYDELIANGWHVLLDLLEASRQQQLKQQQPPNANAVPPTLRESALLFRNQALLTSDERALYGNNTNLLAAFLDGCSIVLNHADGTSPWLAALCDDLQESLPHAYVNAYLTPANAQTAPPHADDRDVIVIQVYGAKTWTVYRNVPVPFPYSHEQVGKEGREVPLVVLEGSKMIETTLYPGDVLYMPRGYVHHAQAIANQSSFHATVALATQDWNLGGILSQAVTSALRPQIGLRQALPRQYGQGSWHDLSPPDQADLQGAIDHAIESIRAKITGQAVHDHLRSKFRFHNDQADRIRQAVYQRATMIQGGPKKVVVGFQAARHVDLGTWIRAATPEEREQCRAASASQQQQGPTGLQVREEVADEITQILSHLRRPHQPPCRVQDMPQCLSIVPPTLCDLTLVAFCRFCVELGALAVATDPSTAIIRDRGPSSSALP